MEVGVKEAMHAKGLREDSKSKAFKLKGN